jgi:hypothetical protein
MNCTVYVTRDLGDEGDLEIAVDVDLKMTFKGYKGRGPSFDHPGDPPEAPEFELIKMVTLEGYTLTREEQDKAYDIAVDMAIEDMDNDRYAY